MHDSSTQYCRPPRSPLLIIFYSQNICKSAHIYIYIYVHCMYIYNQPRLVWVSIICLLRFGHTVYESFLSLSVIHLDQDVLRLHFCLFVRYPSVWNIYLSFICLYIFNNRLCHLRWPLKRWFGWANIPKCAKRQL